ncbi:MAG: hypothetical protein ACKVYV_16965, partial [Limisphaerales bacterium]
WHRVNLPHGDGSVRLNLLLGKTDNAAAADLEFSTRLLFPGDARRKYDRQVSIRVLGHGGMAFTEDVYPFRAATNGYAAGHEFLLLPSEGRRDWDWRRNVYLRLRGGAVHAGLSLVFTASRLEFELAGHANPQGSILLEPDEAKLVTDPDEIVRLDAATRARAR